MELGAHHRHVIHDYDGNTHVSQPEDFSSTEYRRQGHPPNYRRKQ